MFFRIVVLISMLVTLLCASIPTHKYSYMESMRANSPENLKIKVVDIEIKFQNRQYEVRVIAEVKRVYKSITNLRIDDIIIIKYTSNQFPNSIPILEKNKIYNAYLIDSVTIFNYSPYAMSRSFN